MHHEHSKSAIKHDYMSHRPLTFRCHAHGGDEGVPYTWWSRVCAEPEGLNQDHESKLLGAWSKNTCVRFYRLHESMPSIVMFRV